MKWSSVKTIMLTLLLVMNVFVLGTLIVKRATGEKIPPVVRSAAVEALGGSGIVCGEELLPENYLTMQTFGGGFPTAAELSRMFFGREVAFQTEDRTLTAREGGAELKVEEESFSYKASGSAASSSEKELREALGGLGLDMSRAVYRGGGEFAMYYDGRPVFGMYLRAALDGEGRPVSVEARWPSAESSGQRRTGLSIISCIPDMLERFPQGGRVTGLEAGYTPVRSEDTGAYSFEPAWRITMEDGESEVFVCVKG